MFCVSVGKCLHWLTRGGWSKSDNSDDFNGHVRQEEGGLDRDGVDVQALVVGHRNKTTAVTVVLDTPHLKITRTLIFLKVINKVFKVIQHEL